ncbi:MAG: protein adenylyltransferase SelO family protein [Gammaproteobacteria bacterium]|nr:protein adenylyltransferase SelO family protein [Gammaproteobacteria bacterium]
MSSESKSRYKTFSSLNGNHPLKDAVPAIYVGYDAFYRKDGEVFYFNFKLAKEIGLISSRHEHQLNPELEDVLLNTFSLQIINEYDILHNVEIDKSLIKKYQYMATRYLQLQHANKSGMTSGDGRSIWNGSLKTRKGAWDVSSCGTGATRLSPASANEKTFFKTGDENVAYGCGRADLSEGVVSSIFSEMLHNEGISTERTLLVIRYKDGSAINVRVAPNLLRPAHFFGFLKRNNLPAIKELADYYIQREQENGNLLDVDGDIYDAMLAHVSKRFARAAAIFESEYLFCWMDWDGDNILMDGGIIDYGTVRQFGLFHHHYRYSDVEQMSTTITEQKNKARQTIQTFTQLVDYLQTGTKKNKKQFRNHWAIDLFNNAFHLVLLQQLLKHMGFQKHQVNTILLDEQCYALLDQFQKQFRYFEKATAGRKEYSVADGIMRDAIFCMRDFLREFPAFYLEHQRIYTAQEFIDVVSSDYASRLDKAKYRKQAKRIARLQETYLSVVKQAGIGFQMDELSIIQDIVARAAIIDREDKLTGNGVLELTDKVVKQKNRLSKEELHSLIDAIVLDNTLNPDFENSWGNYELSRSEAVQKLLRWTRRQRWRGSKMPSRLSAKAAPQASSVIRMTAGHFRSPRRRCSPE